MRRDDGLAEASVIELTGLPVGSPIGFMAALGLLRVCAQDHGRSVRLSWSAAHARLHGMAADEVQALLVEHMRGRSKAPEFNFSRAATNGGSTLAMHLRDLTPADFRNAVAACGDDVRALAFMAGFATDAVVNDNSFVARTTFDFSSGQQKLLEEFRQLAVDLSPETKRPRVALADRIARALFGGPYEARHTFGWDAAALMTHAHQPRAPTASTPPGQPMTVWLAVESLALHPVLPVTARRARTAGFDAIRGYVWPQWLTPLSLAEVTLLRARPVDTLDRLPGVDAVWRSAVTSVGKYGFLLPAARTPSDGGS